MDARRLVQRLLVAQVRVNRDSFTGDGEERQTARMVTAPGMVKVFPPLTCMKSQNIPIGAEESDWGSRLLPCISMPRSQPKMMEQEHKRK